MWASDDRRPSYLLGPSGSLGSPREGGGDPASVEGGIAAGVGRSGGRRRREAARESCVDTVGLERRLGRSVCPSNGPYPATQTNGAADARRGYARADAVPLCEQRMFFFASQSLSSWSMSYQVFLFDEQIKHRKKNSTDEE